MSFRDKRHAAIMRKVESKMCSDDGSGRNYRFTVSVVMGSKPYEGGRLDRLRPQRWSAMLTAYWRQRFSDRAWDQWIESVNNQWPVTFIRQSPLLRNTNGTHAYEYGQDFAVCVDAPSWIQARKYVEECLKPIVADQSTIYPASQDGGGNKISEELAHIGGKGQNAGENYEPAYPEIQFGASGRDGTIGIVRIDVSDAQLETIIEQAYAAVDAENQTLFSPHIPLRSESSREQLETAVQQIRDGEEVLATLDFSGEEDRSDPATTSLVFVVSDTGARQLGNAIETIDQTEAEADSESAVTKTALVYPELVTTHTEELIGIATIALETDGRGVIGVIPSDSEPIDLDWVREYGPPDPSIEVLGFRSELLEEREEEFPEKHTGLSRLTEDTEQDQQEDQEQKEIETEDLEELSEYRISVELVADDILAEQFDESYVGDVPINNFEAEDGGLHIPNPEFCIFIDISLSPEQKEVLQEKLEEIDITEKMAEMAVLKAPIEPNSIHQELIIEIFPHFKLVELRERLRPLIEDAGGIIHTEELPYFVKYSSKDPYYITQDISSLSNPERKLTEEEQYYNERRVELIHAHTDYRRVIDAENLTLSLTENKIEADP